MGPLPPLPIKELFVFAVIGAVLSAIIGLGVIGWGGYHVVRALIQYNAEPATPEPSE